jgi:hypothetical protein
MTQSYNDTKLPSRNDQHEFRGRSLLARLSEQCGGARPIAYLGTLAMRKLAATSVSVWPRPQDLPG